MREAILDTDILSYYFRGDNKVVGRTNNYLNEFDVINITIITYYEIMGGLKFKDAKNQLTEFIDFIYHNNIIHITENSALISSEIYSNLRKKGCIIGTSDILIAGIAIENDLTLITNNVKHYEPIAGLKLENWKR